MAELKAHEVEAWLGRLKTCPAVVLVYGPDRGLVSERAARLAALAGVALDDPFSTVRLDAQDLDREPGRLLVEAQTVSMFSPQRLLWVRGAGAQKTLAQDVKALATTPSPDAMVIVEAGDLKKGAPLRSAVEGAREALAVPCYGDDAKAVDALIDAELGEAGLSIDLDARTLLKASLGGDRMASRGELRKLALYAHGRQRIELADVRALTGDVSARSADDVIDAALSGDLAGFDSAFRRLGQSGQAAAQILPAGLRSIQALHQLRAGMEKDGTSAASAVAAARPPVFFGRRRLVEAALARWDVAGLTAVLDRLHAAVLQSRRRADLAASVAHQTLLQIAIESRRRSRRD